MQMDELIEFLQQTLAVDFYFEDDYVIEQALRENLQELRSSRLHTAGDSNIKLASLGLSCTVLYSFYMQDHHPMLSCLRNHLVWLTSLNRRKM